MVTSNSYERNKKKQLFSATGTEKKSIYFNKAIAGKETPNIVPLPKEDDLEDSRPGLVKIART